MNEKSTSLREPDVTRGNALYERAKAVIPTGTMLLSKRQEGAAPGSWPAYYKRAWGCRVEDIDGNTYTDITGDVGATMLGRADPDVNAAVQTVIEHGNFCQLNFPREVELAERLTELIPCAEQVRFCRGGGEADVIAIRIARGFTGKDKIAFCGYHGWHDWYLSANLGDNTTLDGHLLPGLQAVGVPRGLAGTNLPFEYNNLDSLRSLLESHPGEFAAIIMEATRGQAPAPGFLKGVRALADEHGAVLIFDEVVTGFRMAPGGAQEYFGVTPDMATFAKTISNGYPMGAVVGRGEIMSTATRQFISSTYWTDAIGSAAALATLTKMKDTDVVTHIWDLGRRLMSGVRAAVDGAAVDGKLTGWPPVFMLSFAHEDADMPMAMKAFYTRRMLARGFLANGVHYLMLPHTEAIVDLYLDAVREVLRELDDALANGTLLQAIDNRPSQPHFRRLA